MQFKKELDEKDSLLVIAEYNRNKDIDDRNQEIMTLQQLLQETCDEASVANNEISMLKNEISRLKETIVQQVRIITKMMMKHSHTHVNIFL